MSSLASAAAPKTISLAVYSSPLCPFCYGLRNIQKAQQATPDVKYQIQFHPFLLDPTLSTTPINKRERYEAKFGGKEKVAAMERVMKEKAKNVGINLTYDGDVSQPTDALRLLALAWEQGGEERQSDLMGRFFKGYFENAKDLGDRSFLVPQAVEANVFASADEAESFLSSTAFAQEVQDGYRKASALGISGVPFTVIDGKFAVEGAQPAEVFADIFGKVATGISPA